MHFARRMRSGGGNFACLDPKFSLRNSPELMLMAASTIRLIKEPANIYPPSHGALFTLFSHVRVCASVSLCVPRFCAQFFSFLPVVWIRYDNCICPPFSRRFRLEIRPPPPPYIPPIYSVLLQARAVTPCILWEINDNRDKKHSNTIFCKSFEKLTTNSLNERYE